MTDGPLTLVRRRIARSLDWRVDNAVRQATESQRAEVLAFIGHKPGRPDTASRLDSLEAQCERLDASIERLRASVATLSVTLTDAQRAHGELLDRLAVEVDRLTSQSTPSTARAKTAKQ